MLSYQFEFLMLNSNKYITLYYCKSIVPYNYKLILRIDMSG